LSEGRLESRTDRGRLKREGIVNLHQSMKLNDVSIKQVFQAVHKLNNRPRKCLGFKTPYEVFQQLTHHIKFFIGVALHLNPPFY